MHERPDILVDTYNLRLEHGTGIKTYGLSLLEALQRLNRPATLLTDKRVPHSKHNVVREALLYDHPRKQKRWRNAARLIRNVIQPARPTVIDVTHVIRSEGFVPDHIQRVHNLASVYERANGLFRRFGYATGISMHPCPKVWHATTPLPIRVRGARTVTTIHDLIPLRLPYTTLDDKQFFHKLVQHTLKNSDLIFAVSECTKRDIHLLFDVPDEKVVVTWQSLPAGKEYSRPPHEGFAQALLERNKLKPGQYLLFVGNIEPKKNLATLIHALAMLPKELPLVVVGRKAWLWEKELEPAEQLFGKEFARRVLLLGYMPTAAIQALYAHALCFVFPSIYEGFGLPPLEAMRQGCPVIASTASSVPEVCGDGALYFDPRDPDELRKCVEQLISRPETRDRLIAAGRERVEFFSPQRYAERLAKAYAPLLG